METWRTKQVEKQTNVFTKTSGGCVIPVSNNSFNNYFKDLRKPELKNCQNGTFEPVHEIQKLSWPKDFFWSIMKMTLTKNITNISQGLPNPGFRTVKVQNWDYFFNPSQELKNLFCLGFLWIPRKTGRQN